MEKSHRKNKRRHAFFSLGLLLCVIVITTFWQITPTEAQNSSITELQRKIDEKSKEIDGINKEIKKYQNQLQVVAKEANTLQGTIKSLDLTQSKLLKDIDLTETKIGSTNLNLSKLEIEIYGNEKRILSNTDSLVATLKQINEAGESSVIEVFLRYNDLSSFWDELETLESFQVGVQEKLEDLKTAKKILEEKINETEEQKEKLEGLKSDFDAQNKIVEINKKQKKQLLTETKNTEAEYKKILARNLERKEKFEKELFEFESQLKISIDPTKLPSPRKGILSWPLENIVVTQYFGKTVDSKKLYASGTHNGVDFRASMGTRVLSALEGVVSHIGNTDEVSGCYSFGRWVLIKHDNGLSTLYSHLSSIQVSVGQRVEKGQTIAFSGGAPGTPGAGYSTGPHLHFGVYATEGLSPQRYQSKTSCNGAFMPLADQKAYLDPISFLPVS